MTDWFLIKFYNNNNNKNTTGACESCAAFHEVVISEAREYIVCYRLKWNGTTYLTQFELQFNLTSKPNNNNNNSSQGLEEKGSQEITLAKNHFELSFQQHKTHS